MGEEMKIILGELQKINGRLDGIDKRLDGMDKRFDEVDRRFAEVDKRFEEVSGRFDIVDEKINVMYNESTREFGVVRQELQTVHKMLADRISDIDALTTQNCRDITRLRALKHA